MGAASSSPAVSPAAGRASKSHTFLEEVSAGGEKSASLKRAKSSRINNFGKRNSEPMADYDDEFAEAHAEFLRETMARRNSDVDVGEGRRFMEYQESAVEKVAQTEIRKAIAGPQTQQLDDDDNEAPDPSFRVRRSVDGGGFRNRRSVDRRSVDGRQSDRSSAVDRRSAADRRSQQDNRRSSARKSVKVAPAPSPRRSSQEEAGGSPPKMTPPQGRFGKQESVGRKVGFGAGGGAMGSMKALFSRLSASEARGGADRRSSQEALPGAAGGTVGPPAEQQAALFQVLLGGKVDATKLDSSGLFYVEDEPGVVRLSPAWQLIDLAADAVLIEQGADDGKCCYVVATGSFDVKVRKEDGTEVVVANIAEGGFFGELALLYSTRRTATVVAREAATAWALHRDVYQALLERGTRRDRRARRLFLQRMPIFSELGRQHVQTVAQYVHEVELYADEAVSTSTLQTTGDGSDLNSIAGLDGHGGDAVFIVYSGLVEARRTDRRQSSRGASESKAAPGAPDYHLTAGDIVGVGSEDDRAFLQSVLQAASAARNDPTAIRPDGGFLPSRIQLWLSPDSGAAAEYDFSARGAGARPLSRPRRAPSPPAACASACPTS